MRHHLNLEADEFNFLRVCKVPVSLMDDPDLDSFLDQLMSLLLLNQDFFSHLCRELTFQVE